jgi:hypothetical protein
MMTAIFEVTFLSGIPAMKGCLEKTRSLTVEVIWPSEKLNNTGIL